MPHVYKTKRRGEHKYLTCSEEILKLCLQAVESGHLSIRKASKTFDIL